MAWRSRPNRPELDATKIPTAIDIAWSAGVYEGEGTARLCGRGKRSLAVSVPQKEPEILIRMRDWFGGNVCSPSGKGCYTWNICGDRARIFIALIHPFLSAKRRIQVDSTDAIEFLGDKSPDGMSVEDLALHLSAFYEDQRAYTWRGAKRQAVRRANYLKRKAEDSTFLARLVERNREWKRKQEELTRGN